MITESNVFKDVPSRTYPYTTITIVADNPSADPVHLRLRDRYVGNIATSET